MEQSHSPLELSETGTHPQYRPMLLIVLDGWGYSESTQYNAIHSASKPTWDSLWTHYPHMLIRCSGMDVGLPDGQMGNSEVGHMHIGAGRVIPQKFTRISQAIEDGSFFDNPVMVDAFNKAADGDHAVHLMGLLSPGGVHSHEDHIIAAIEMAHRCGVDRIYLHAFLDGRDMPPKSAADSLLKVKLKFAELGHGAIATLIGRFYAMDRNMNWDRTKAAYRLIVDGKAEYDYSDPFIALDMAYKRDETDEFVSATAIHPRDAKPVRVNDGDVVIAMNYRADRVRQITQAFIEEDFDCFIRGRRAALSAFVSLTRYHPDFDIPVAFPRVRLNNTFGEYISTLGLHQLRLAETEKYAHVTFFFNGGEERVFPGEDRILVPSPHVKTYDEKPEMSAYQVTDRLVEAIHSGKYDVIICNYANADMVGHSGNFDAAVRAIEALDRCLGRVVAAIQSVGGELLITADHGNAERMREVSTKKKRGQPYTAHTSGPVPLLYVGRPAGMINSGSLADIAPTMLALMALPIPEEMTGQPLVVLEDTGERRTHTRLGRLLG